MANYCPICWEPDCKVHDEQYEPDPILGPFESETSSIQSYSNTKPNADQVNVLLARRIRVHEHLYASDNQVAEYTDKAVQFVTNNNRWHVASVHRHSWGAPCREECVTFYRG